MNIENLLNTDKRHTLITQKSTLPMVDLIVVIGICFFYFLRGRKSICQEQKQNGHKIQLEDL